jgi:hypothetical protein
MPRFIVLLCALFSSALAAQEFGEHVEKRGEYHRDLYLAGGVANSHAVVTGDVTAAGGRVVVEGEISDDVLAFGGIVTIAARVHHDVRAAGGVIHLRGEIGEDAVLAGGHLALDRNVWIQGRALLAGKDIEVAGKVDQSVHAAASSIRVDGEIGGDAKLIGRSIEIGPNAIIYGNLDYRSPTQARIDASARILGTVTHVPLESLDTRAHETSGRLFFAVSLFITAVILYLLFPRFATDVAHQVRESPLRCLGLGVVMTVVVPLTAAFMMMTMVGMWLGMLLLALYLPVLLVGYLAGVLFIADFGVRELRGTHEMHRGWTIAALAVAFVILTLLSWMPWIAGLTMIALMLLGAGGLTQEIWNRVRASPESKASPM